MAIEEASWPMTTAREAGSMDGRRKGAEDRRAKKDEAGGRVLEPGGAILINATRKSVIVARRFH